MQESGEGGSSLNLTRGVHSPCGMSTGYSADNRRDISALEQGAISRILCSCMAISKVWE